MSIALKIIRVMNQKSIERVIDEIISLTKLKINEEDNLNLIKLIQWFQIENNYYLCFELIQNSMTLA